ncbi:MAG: DUF4430 domain-containing protein [Eubacterium sp.]
MRFFKRNWKSILSAVIVFLIVVATIAGTSIRSVENEKKQAIKALQPVELGEEQVIAKEANATEPEKKKEKQHKSLKKEKGKATQKPEKKTEKKCEDEEESSDNTKASLINKKLKNVPMQTVAPKKKEEVRHSEEAEKEDNRKISDGTDTEKDKYETDPVPSGMPLPVDKEDQEVDNDEEFYVTISIDCLTILQNMENLKKGKEQYIGDGWILKPTKVKCKKGQTVYDMLEQVCKAYSIQLETTTTPLYGSRYIEGIGNLYKLDCGDLSGWMYNVDGWYPNYGCSRYVLEAGEVIEWRYTCKGLGKDLENKVKGGEE